MYIEVEGTLQSRFEIGKLIKNSAFPFEIEHKDGKVYAKGLTKREYFAAMAMQGILANPNTSHQIESQYGKIDANEANRILVNTATELSDALILALHKPQP